MTAEQMLEKYKLTPEDMANYAIWGYVCDAMDAFASHEVAEVTKQRDEFKKAFEEMMKQRDDLLIASRKILTWIKTHPRKATIVQHVIDEFEDAISKIDER